MKRKPISAPNVVHGNSKTEQMSFFKDQADQVKRKYHTVNGGKGSAPRSNNSKEYLTNYDEIFRKPTTNNNQ